MKNSHDAFRVFDETTRSETPPVSSFLNQCTYGTPVKADTLDVFPLVFVAFAPPLIAFFGAVAVTNAAEEAINALIDVVYNAAPRQRFIEKFTWFLAIWLLIPALQFAVVGVAVRISIYSRLARRLVPWLLAAGFVASLISITSYSRFFSMLREGWREMTQFVYITPMLLTYITVARRLDYD